MFYLASIVGLLVLYTVSVTVFDTQTSQKLILKRRDCYYFPNNPNGEILEDISNAKVKPDDGRAIFFLMTTCLEKSEIILSAR